MPINICQASAYENIQLPFNFACFSNNELTYNFVYFGDQTMEQKNRYERFGSWQSSNEPTDSVEITFD